MTTQPNYLQYLTSAKQAKVAEQLRRAGYQVEEQKREKDTVFDLVATKAGRSTVYEFKSAGQPRFSREQLIKLQTVAANAGYRYQFRIVVAVPPPRVDIEVEGLEAALFEYLLDHFPSELDTLSSHTLIEAVSDISISSIHVGRGGVQLSGAASVSVQLQYGGSSDSTSSLDSFPMTFSALVDGNGSVQSVSELEIDTSDFYE